MASHCIDAWLTKKNHARTQHTRKDICQHTYKNVSKFDLQNFHMQFSFYAKIMCSGDMRFGICWMCLCIRYVMIVLQKTEEIQSKHDKIRISHLNWVG